MFNTLQALKKGDSIPVMKRILPLLLLFPTLAFAQELAPHRALYDFSLVASQPDAGLTGIGGKMYFELGDACDAWSTEHRFRTQYRYAEDRAILDTSHYAAYESKDGREFSFNSVSEEDGEVTEQLRGRAARTASGGTEAIYSRPQGVSHALPEGYLLPSAHTLEIVRRARAGEHFFSAVMFDGTDSGGPVEIGTFIGPPATPAELAKIAAGGKIDKALLTPEAWHVRMAVFPLADGENIDPAYEMQAVMHANGVISDARIDYKAFSVQQTLAALEKIPAVPCPK